MKKLKIISISVTFITLASLFGICGLANASVVVPFFISTPIDAPENGVDINIVSRSDFIPDETASLTIRTAPNARALVWVVLPNTGTRSSYPADRLKDADIDGYDNWEWTISSRTSTGEGRIELYVTTSTDSALLTAFNYYAIGSSTSLEDFFPSRATDIRHFKEGLIEQLVLDSHTTLKMFPVSFTSTPVVVPGPGEQQWNYMNEPYDLEGYKITANSTPIDFVFSGNNGYLIEFGYGTVKGHLFRSTDSGLSWSDKPSLQSATGYSQSIPLVAVAVAPDDQFSIAITDGINVWISSDGGSNISNLPAVSLSSTNQTITGVAIGPARTGLLLPREYAVTVANNTPGTTTGGDVLILGSNASWTPVGGSSNNGTRDYLTVQFSPNYLNDLTLIAVGANTTAISLQEFKTNDNTVLSTSDLVIGTGLDVGGSSGLVVADIAFPADFNPAIASTNKVYVATASGSGNDDVFRVTPNGTPATTALGLNSDIASVTYDGTSNSGTLFAGYYASNYIRRSSSPDASSPDWTNAAKKPTGTNVKVRLDSNYASNQTIYALTKDDNLTTLGGSAFSVSTDNGVSFKQTSMIDYQTHSNLGSILDFQFTADESDAFYLTNDKGSASLYDGSIHLWRAGGIQSASTSWTQLFTLPKAADSGNHTALLALNPAWTTVPAIFVVDNTADGPSTIYVSKNAGATWSTRTGPGSTRINAIAATNADTVYVSLGTGTGTASFYKSTNAGFIWGDAVTVSGLGAVTEIIVAPTGELIAGGNGRIAISTNQGVTWSANLTGLTSGVRYFPAVDANYATNHTYFVAGTDGSVWRRGPSDAAWLNISPSGPVTTETPRIQFRDGALYVLSNDRVLRSLNYLDAGPPTTGDPYDDSGIPLIWSSISPSAAVFGTEETVVLQAPVGALVELTPIYQVGTRNFRSAAAKPPNQIVPASGRVTFSFTPVINTNLPGPGAIEVKVNKVGFLEPIVVTHPIYYNNPVAHPEQITWVSIDPPEALAHSDARVTISLIVPPGAYVYVIYILPKTGTRSTISHDEKVADANGNVTLSFSIHHDVNDGEGTLEFTVVEPSGTRTVVTRPYMNSLTPASVTTAWEDMNAGTSNQNSDDLDFEGALRNLGIYGDNVLMVSTPLANVFTYHDFLANNVPTIVSPSSGDHISIDPNTGGGESVTFAWNAMGTGTGLATSFQIETRETGGISTLHSTFIVSYINAPSVSSSNLVPPFTAAANKEYQWRLRVRNTISNDYVNSAWTEWQTFSFTQIPVSGSTGGGGGEGGGSGTTVVGDVMAGNQFLYPAVAKSTDQKVIINIPQGTVATTDTGRLTSISILVQRDLPESVQSWGTDARAIGVIYNIQPEGTTFDPPVDLSLKYDSEDKKQIPPGVEEKNLVIATYDAKSGQWLMLDSTVDPVSGTVTARIGHFSLYTIIARTSPASFTVSNLSVTPQEVVAGESVTISALVANTGNLAGSHMVNFTIDGYPVQSKTVTLSGGGSETVMFSIASAEAGEHKITVGDLAGTYQVKMPLTPASFTVGNLLISPGNIKVGEKTIISVTLTNTGETQGTYVAKLKIDNEVVETKEVILEGGTSENVAFIAVRDEAGTYKIDAGGLTGSFTVKEDAPSAPEPSANTGETVLPVVETALPTKTSSTNWWLIGGSIFGVSLIGLTSSMFIFRRRRTPKIENNENKMY